jgi:hypothetical protein
MDEDVSSPHVLFVNNVTYILCFSDEVFWDWGDLICIGFFGWLLY